MAIMSQTTACTIKQMCCGADVYPTIYAAIFYRFNFYDDCSVKKKLGKCSFVVQPSVVYLLVEMCGTIPDA